MHNKSVAQLITGLRAKDFSSEELTRYFLDRIARLDSAYNSFISVDESSALAAARAADQRLAAGTEASLTGIPAAARGCWTTLNRPITPP
jgi:aspartyl-tRNA(Asn)/glutamyl-tRNA(Gln) amidotransferase subunit A